MLKLEDLIALVAACLDSKNITSWADILKQVRNEEYVDIMTGKMMVQAALKKLTEQNHPRAAEFYERIRKV